MRYLIFFCFLGFFASCKTSTTASADQAVLERIDHALLELGHANQTYSPVKSRSETNPLENVRQAGMGTMAWLNESAYRFMEEARTPR
ncbi:hypothetical protein [Neolewinella antarctica]|uniref:Uncharacterized protein n=1 Tax=Neolewinella antarctica TaxID=442734 RepID=A0ABX0XFE6_9BACT|nr:hypothetical protein [Neolewinella antarctica]NJC28043.1 hypothetical protein [Neolewinella antarctica]